MRRLAFASWFGVLATIASCSPARRPAVATVPSETSGATTLAPNATITPLECREHPEIAFPSSLTACESTSDCIAVEHGVDCCGRVLIAGLAASRRVPFDEIEASCRARVTFRTCHCAAPVTTQLGESVTSATPVRVRCMWGTCVASVAEPRREPVQQSETVTPSSQRGPVVCAGTPCGNACCEADQRCINGPVSPGQMMCWPPRNGSCADGGDCLPPPVPVQ